MAALHRISFAALAVLVLASARAGAQDLDAGKSGAQLFASDCVSCHRRPQGLVKTTMAWSLRNFLRQHYTTNARAAAELTAYLLAVEASARAEPRAADRRKKSPARGEQAAARPTSPGEPRPSAARRPESPAAGRPPQAAPDDRRPAAGARRGEPTPSRPAAPAATEPPAATAALSPSIEALMPPPVDPAEPSGLEPGTPVTTALAPPPPSFSSTPLP